MKNSQVNHKLHFVSPTDPRVHTQSIEATWSALKRGLKSSYGVAERHIRGYLSNYMFRRYYGNTKILNHLRLEMAKYDPNELPPVDADDDLPPPPSQPDNDADDDNDH